MAEITVLQLMDIIEKDESIRNYQSRWRELRSLLEKQAEVASQQSFAPDVAICDDCKKNPALEGCSVCAECGL